MVKNTKWNKISDETTACYLFLNDTKIDIKKVQYNKIYFH